VILGYIDLCNPDMVRTLQRKLAPPLVTLLNSEPEIQYVALRNINLIVQKRPQILEHEIKVGEWVGGWVGGGGPARAYWLRCMHA
jgi:AP-1 complex subunit beta-1